jgi:hypothetical protein
MSACRSEAMQQQFQNGSHPDLDDFNTYVVQTGTYNTQNHLDPHIRASSVESWDNLRETMYVQDNEASQGTQKYFSEHFHNGWMPPIEPNAQHSRLGIPYTDEARRASTVTVFPSFTAFTKKPEPRSKSRWNNGSETESPNADTGQSKPIYNESEFPKSQPRFTQLCRVVRDIYRAGPQGEGQDIWTSCGHFLKEKQTGTVLEMCSPKRTNESLCRPPVEWKAARPKTRHPPADTCLMSEDVDHPKPRQDSVVSNSSLPRTSCEVPIKFQRTFLDTIKPSPLTRKLSAMPRYRQQGAQGNILNLNKPLPRTPLPYSPDIRKTGQHVVVEYPIDPSRSDACVDTVDFSVSGTHSKTPFQDNSTSDQRLEQIDKGGKSTTWLKALASNASENQVPFTNKSVSDKATGKLKAPPSPKTWRNMFVYTMPTVPKICQSKKRPTSEMSFTCQGLVDGHMYDGYVMAPGSSVQDKGPPIRKGEEILRPEPLFSRAMGDGEGRPDESYYYVKDVHAGQRRVGKCM